MFPRSIVLAVFFVFAGMLARPSMVDAQCNPGVGTWSSVYDWESQINSTACGIGGASTEYEFSHAALIPQGFLRGSVLLWRKERAATGCGAGNTPRTWIFNPSNPNTLWKIPQQLSSDGFCAGQSWDKHGQLIVCGGIAQEAGCPPACLFPVETYRFRPQLLEGGITPGGGGVITSNPWKRIGDMVIRRYYPTTIALHRDPVFRSLLPVGLPPNEQLSGAAIMVAGGPTFQWPDDQGLASGADGNEYWELMPPVLGGTATSWYPPFLPQSPTVHDDYYGDATWPYGENNNPNWDKNSPHFAAFPSATYDGYQRPTKPGTPPYADRVFDSYPRMFQTSAGGEILTCGDVDTGRPPANEPGTTWVIKPRMTTGGVQTNWESHVGPEGPDPVGTDIWHDSQYDTSFLLHDFQFPDRKDNRILMFGGSRNAGTLATPIWMVNDQIWEFEPATIDPRIVNGIWTAKTSSTNFQRIFANAVILPTGEILIEGGSSVDTFNQPPPSVPVYAPIIYNPGLNRLDPGVISQQPARATDPMPRLYHHVAALLPDGSVFIAGGQRRLDSSGQFIPMAGGTEPDPRFNGEIFLPPYLDFATTQLTRPIVMTAPPSQVAFSETIVTKFTMQVDRSVDGTIDSVALLRPAAITHHYDNDQRYIELKFVVTLTEDGGPGRKIDTLEIDSPHESLGPPGYFMLFAIEAHNGCSVQGHRVPTHARFIQIL